MSTPVRLPNVLHGSWHELAEALAEAGTWAVEWNLPGPSFEIDYASDRSSVTFIPDSPVVESDFRIAGIGDEVVFFVLPRYSQVPAEELDAWQAMADIVIDRVATPKPMPWIAVIGTTPEQSHPWEQAEQRLVRRRRANVGALSIESAGRPMLEVASNSSVDYVKLQRSWPILVRGVSPRPHDWGVAAHVEAGQIHRLCCLLALAWDKPWSLRRSPDAEAAGAISIPAFIGSKRVPAEFRKSSPKGKPHPVHLAPWVRRAWGLLDDDPSLLPLLHAHYQGISLHGRSPSMALIGFVAVVESLGTRFVKARRCRVCGALIGSGAAFRAALDRAVEDPDARQDLRRAYDRRSKTAHSGHMHGGEPTFGLRWDTFEPSPSLAFSLGLSWDIRQASRTLLIRALQQEL